jgi:hypothetical protein
MVPEMGPRVRKVEPHRYFVAGDQEAGSWCLALYPTASGCRLVSRWRMSWSLTPATAFWILLSDPGAFIMERKMLKGIRSRAEAMVRNRERRLLQASGSELLERKLALVLVRRRRLCIRAIPCP